MRKSIQCPKCGTWNEVDPELATCWNCFSILPLPKEKDTTLINRIQLAIEVTNGALVRAQQVAASRDIKQHLDKALIELYNAQDASI